MLKRETTPALRRPETVTSVEVRGPGVKNMRGQTVNGAVEENEVDPNTAKTPTRIGSFVRLSTVIDDVLDDIWRAVEEDLLARERALVRVHGGDLHDAVQVEERA